MTELASGRSENAAPSSGGDFIEIALSNHRILKCLNAIVNRKSQIITPSYFPETKQRTELIL